MTNHDYEEGVRDGKLSALEAVQRRHEDRLDKHEARLLVAERIIYLIIGAISLIELYPHLKTFMA